MTILASPSNNEYCDAIAQAMSAYGFTDIVKYVTYAATIGVTGTPPASSGFNGPRVYFAKQTSGGVLVYDGCQAPTGTTLAATGRGLTTGPLPLGGNLLILGDSKTLGVVSAAGGHVVFCTDVDFLGATRTVMLHSADSPNAHEVTPSNMNAISLSGYEVARQDSCLYNTPVFAVSGTAFMALPNAKYGSATLGMVVSVDGSNYIGAASYILWRYA